MKGWTVKEVYHLEGVSGKQVSDHPEAKRMLQDVRRGYITGLVFSKQGLFGGFSPISANVIRMLAATSAMWLFTAIQGQAGPTIRTLRADPNAVKLLALGAFLGPVAGVSLSLLAVQNIKIGVASVLTSLSPVFMLPFGYFFFKDRVGWQAILGTLVAMAGVVILFLF